jgi:hypothetical protein
LGLITVADIHNGIVTAIATVLLTFITWFLWKLERDGATANEALLRAYVSVSAKGIRVDPIKPDEIVVFLDVRNSGQTPAFNVISIPIIGVYGSPPVTFEVPKMDRNHATARNAPATTLSKDTGITCAPSRSFTSADRDACAATDRLYVYGRTLYSDVFGEEQWIEFCQFLEMDQFSSAYAMAVENNGDIVKVSFKIAHFGNRVSYAPAI